MGAPASDAVRVRVSAVILVDGRLVLVRHRRDGRTYHLLPGGGVEAGETLPAAVSREVGRAMPIFFDKAYEVRVVDAGIPQMLVTVSCTV